MKKPLLSHAAAVFACLGLVTSMTFAEKPARRSFGKNKPFTVEELPAGKLKAQLQTLNPQAKGKALKWLHEFNFDSFDAAKNLRADKEGGIFIVCPDDHGNCDGHSQEPATTGSTNPSSSVTESNAPEPDQNPEPPPVAGVAVPISSPPAYHSKAGATRFIYLDYNGGVVAGKAWNSSYGVASWDCKAWDTDGNFTTFSDSEQAEIRRAWERISEDYAPFDIDVTTDAAYDPDNYTGDKNKVGWLMFTATTDKNGAACPHNGYGGIAYVGVYGNGNYFSTYQPAWVAPYSADNATEAGSHEMGHNMGLSHDGTSSLGYYGGHNATASAPSWGPIMGTGYGRNVTQWSKGEYYDPNQLQDDLAIISARAPYRVDDHGDSYAAATVWLNASVNQPGIVERTNNADYFAFTTGAGTITFNAAAYKCDTSTWGGNLDIQLELYNSSQTLIASSNPAADINAAISQSVAAGEYYLVLKPSAAATPTVNPPSGYTVYGSLGQYKITGNFVPTDTIALTAPNGGESWLVGTTQNITWASGMGGNVSIELLKNGVLDSLIAASTPNDGSYSWSIPSNQTVGNDFKIRITSVETPAKSDMSLNNFSLLSLAAALDTTGLTWTTSGNSDWFPQATTTNDGIDAAQSGAIADNQSCSMQTTLTGPGNLTFWWKISSESGWDYLSFFINGVEQTGTLVKISGEVNWVQKTVSIPAGTNTIKWTYSKDSSVASGSDAAWVDQVVYTPATAPEIAVEQPLGTNLIDGSATLDCGPVNLGSSSSPIVVTVINAGTANLSGLVLSKDGAHNADFTLGALGATTLAPGANTTFTVDFTPGAAGNRTAAIHLASNDANENPFDISLTGVGVPLGTLAITPAGNLTFSGTFGGAFSPASLDYTLSNIGSTPIDWTAAKTADWVDLSAANGTLAAGASTTVTVSINSIANSLNAGNYGDTTTFANTTNGNGDTTRAVSLTVNPIAASVNLSGLLQTYDGSPKSATVTTVPPGLTHSITYAGLPDPPTNVGTYAVVATITQPNYSGSSSGNLVISKASQSINFAALDPVLNDVPSIAMTATATSGLTVSYASSNSAVATVSGSSVNIVGLGITTITASQAGNANYNAATSVPQSLTVVRANPLAVITGGPYKVLVSQSLSLNGSASQPSYSETISTYEWDLNNDNIFGDVTDATPAAISFATLTGTWGMVQGLNTVQLKITDSANKTSIVSTTVELVLSLSWDANGTTAGQTNGAGAWLNANRWWDGAANQSWAAGSNAIFGGPSTAGGAVSLASPTTANVVTFNTFTGTYTLGTAGQTITLNNGITKNAGSGIATIISPLNLAGAQTWTNNSAVAINVQAATTLNGVLTVDGSGITSFDNANAIIGGSGGIIKGGTGQLNLSGGATPAHTFTGDITVNGGSIGFQTSAFLTDRNVKLTDGYLGGRYGSGFTWTGGLGTGNNQIQITGGTSGFSGEGSVGSAFQIGTALSTLVWGASGEGSATGYFNPSVFLANGDVRMNTNGKGSLNNGIDLNAANRTITSLQTTDGAASSGFTVNGVISNSSGTAGIIKTGVGNLILAAANTYNGATEIGGGTLQIGNNTASNLGNGNYNGAISIASGATLRIFSSSDQTLGGTISGGGSLVKSYAGNLTLSNSNTYTGKTSLIPQTAAGAGTLGVSSFNSVNGGTPLLANSSLGAPTTVANGTIDFGSTTAQGAATLKYTGSGETTDRVINFLFNGNGATKTLDASGAGLLKFTSTFTGSGSTTNDITLTGSSNGEITGGLPFVFRNFSKSGNGAWTLSGMVGHTGTTTISAGKLALGASNILPNATAVSLGNATLDAATYADTVGTLDVTSTSTINLGIGATLAFADSSAVDWTGGTLNITGTFVPGSSLRFGTSNNGLTSVQLAKISAAGYGPFFLNASGFLTVDATPPTLASIADDKSGSPITVNTLVTYTVTFSEDMDASTVAAADFGNAGTSAITFGSITETSNGIFTVQVTPTSAGTLQLQINATAILKDVAGNNLDTNVAIIDDTTLTVDGTLPTLTSIADDKSGAPIPVNTLVTYTVTYSEDMDASTVAAADFGNAGTSAITVDSITETSPGIFTVQVTPTSAGTLQLQINATAILKDVAGNNLDTNVAIFDDTALTVDGTAPTLASITDDKSGAPVTVDTLVTYTVTFSEDMDASTVAAADFGNAGTSAITFGSITETTPGVFTVQVTPTSAGTLQLQINATAILKDVAGNILDTNVAIIDDTTLTVDGTLPTLTSIADDKSGAPIPVNTLVTYTVTYSEDMDASSVNTADFGNAGTSAITVGSITETSNGILTVQVTPTSAGTLQLQINATAILKDVAGNNLDTNIAIIDDTTLTVDGTAPILNSIADDKSGAPIPVNTLVTYTVSFSEDMDASSVNTADFGNAGTSAITVGSITETSNGIFTVQVTPTSAGTLQLQINATAILKDVAGNNLDTNVAIFDDTALTVDGTAPILNSIADDKSGAPVTVDTLVTYTVTFSEDMDASTVAAEDFGNAGTSAITLGSITETSNGIFTVQVTPTSAGTLQLQINATANLKDVAGNNLDTNIAIIDDTTLTVDGTAPILNSIADDKSGAPITVNTLVSYTVTFSEDMDASSVAAADFGNAGTSVITVGSITETSNGIFTVQVTPTSAGTLQLQINANAILKDVAGNNLDTNVAIFDDTSLTVDGTAPILNSITDDKSGAPVTVDTLVTYTVTFSEDMDASSVNAADFGNAGTSAITISTITETSNGIFTVQVTPTSAGTLQLQINATAILKDVAGNNLDTNVAIIDDTTLTVDGTLPTLTSIADDKSGAPVTVDTLVTYTVTFSEDMDAITVAAADFGNAGTSAITLGSITETSPGIFTVQVTPTSAGTLQLQINANAILKDVAGNNLDTNVAIFDDTTLTVDGTAPILNSIADDKSGAPIPVNTLVTYTVTFSEDMDASSVAAADFGNAGTSAITLGSITETSPGIFTVQVTPTSAGTLQLQINATAILKDVAGNNLDTNIAIIDDTLITVQTRYATWAGGAAFDADANDDGVDNGMAWLLGALNPTANANLLLPVPTHESGKLVLTFRCLQSAHRGTETLLVQYTNDPADVDSWASHAAMVPDADATVDGVVFDITADTDPAFINVRAEIPSSAAASTGRLFGRLYATGN